MEKQTNKLTNNSENFLKLNYNFIYFLIFLEIDIFIIKIIFTNILRNTTVQALIV